MSPGNARLQLGREVGYQIRFENVTSADTRIRFVTEGLLLRQMVQDPKLRGVAALIFDEFHERHLYGDITLARALDLQETERPDLQILVMSATLEAAPLEEYLKPCRVVESRGRTFPVEVEFAAKPAYLDKRPVWEQAAEAFSDFVGSGGQGDVLVFMPGGFEIAQTIEAIRRCDAGPRLRPAPAARRTAAARPGRRGGPLRPAQGRRRHQRRRDLADHRRHPVCD